MQRVYHQWNDTCDWDSATELSPIPRVLEEGLLNGRALARLGRSPALGFHSAVSAGRCLLHVRELDDRALMAITRNTEKELLKGDAEAGLDLLQSDCANMGTLLATHRILSALNDEDEEVTANLAHFEWPRRLAHGRPFLCHNEPFNQVFGDAKYVVVTAGDLFCTCAPFMLYMQCEHVVFAESRSFSCCEAARGFAALPAQRKRGRPQGSISIVGGKK